MDNHTRKMLGLTNENITFPEDWLEDAKIKGVTAQLINGSLTYGPTHCERCDGTKITRTQMALFRNTLTYLELKRSRFLCRNCGQTFMAQTSIVARHDYLVKELKYQILLELAQVRSRKSIAQWFRKKLYFLRKYKLGIQNAFERRYSNGVTEGLINKPFEANTSDSEKNTLCPLRQKTKCELLWFSALALN